MFVFTLENSDWVEGGVIFAIVIFNTALGFSQEYSSEKTLAALQQLSSTQCTVIRDGKQTQINAQQIVPGDIVVLQGGSQVCRCCLFSALRCYFLASLSYR